MAGNKTRDGIKLSHIERALLRIPGVEIESGSKHVAKAVYPGQRPCPIATSTDARRMIVPWVITITSQVYTAAQIYDALRAGVWPYA